MLGGGVRDKGTGFGAGMGGLIGGFQEQRQREDQGAERDKGEFFHVISIDRSGNQMHAWLTPRVRPFFSLLGGVISVIRAEESEVSAERNASESQQRPRIRTMRTVGWCPGVSEYRFKARWERASESGQRPRADAARHSRERAASRAAQANPSRTIRSRLPQRCGVSQTP